MKSKLQHWLITRIIFAFTTGTYCLHATTFTVTTANISGPGSLPVAIIEANSTQGKNQIKITETNIITLGLALPTITNSVAISGGGTVPSVISGGGALPLFTFAAGTTNSLSNLVLANGSTTGNGAAIHNFSTLSVSGCIITNNSANNGSGGAIINSGDMAIASCVISGNQAGQAGSGGAVFNEGTLVMSSSVISGNQAGSGGAAFNEGILVMSILTVSNNVATAGLGGGNSVTAGFGGGICNSGTLAISGSTFALNSATGTFGEAGGMPGNGTGGGGGGGGGCGGGGAVFSSSGTLTITNSTFFQNTAIGGPGGGINGPNPEQGGNGGGASGGVGGGAGENGSGGGVFGGGGGGGYLGYGGSGGFGGGAGGYGFGHANGVGGGDGGSGFGGAILIQAGSLLLVNCTIAANSAVSGSGGIGEDSGTPVNATQGQGCAGGVYNYGGTVSLVNTIVAGNTVATSSPDLVGTFNSLGYNLVGNNQGATNLSIFDFQDVAADLGPLQNNGGPTFTCVPQQGSFAIGYGISTGAPNTDQRGVPRSKGGAYDIGAVQVVTGSPIIVGATMNRGSGFSLSTIFDATNSYRVQASTNLTTWINLTTNGNGGAQQLIDAAATNFTRRFYRTATP